MTTTAVTATDSHPRSQLMGHLTAKWATPVIAVLARKSHPADAAIFGGAAAAFHAQAIEAIAAAHDFGRYGAVVDVGGGTGSLLAAILRANPEVRGVLFELAGVLDAAREQLAGSGVEHRVELVAGDFFTAVPSGDALLIKSCLHNFSDDDAIRVLRVLRAATPEGGRLLVAETVVPAGNEPHYAKFDDIEMLVIAGGVDRSEQEYRELLASGGFRTVAVTPCDDRFSLLEAVPG